MTEQVSAGDETATLGGGCFWCIEAAFLELRGVLDVTSGYAGGASDRPSYREVNDELAAGSAVSVTTTPLL